MVNKFVKNRNLSITTYMIAAVILIHMAVMPFLYHTITNGYKNNSYEQFVSHVTEVAGLLADVLSTKSLQNDREDIINVLSSSILGSNVQYIEVVDSQGVIISPQDGVLSLSGAFKEDSIVNGHGDEVYYLSIPVYFKDGKGTVSSLRIGIDESAVVSDYLSIKKQVAYVLAAYLVAIIILITTITRIIHKPLYQLRDRSREIAGGNIDVPLGLTSRLSEIQYLADDLDKMRLSLVSLAERMQYKASHDELTNLPNRYLFNDSFLNKLLRCQQEINISLQFYCSILIGSRK